ncbi:ThiF family adenylyltransferase [Halomonas sp. R57-5]|uniref:ThiF family adenylyltransferase n=1 Tax=Halomonas sp. R57-5 TaxID=1610576 RepID=UPI0022B2255A|nr:ThiF family adenylyltransferase [Halomonas sp. R57-5]
MHCAATWRVDLPKGYLQHPSVDYVFLTIDDAFPLSEPRVVAPQAVMDNALYWPHIERDGVLCLTTTKYSAHVGQRVLTMLQHAVDVLAMDSEARTIEFRREFLSYWSQQIGPKEPHCYALLSPRSNDRDIYYHSARTGQIIFADDPSELSSWLKNAGIKAEALLTTRVVWPAQIPTPDQYPVKGRDIIKLVGREHIERHVRAGYELPLVMGFMINGAPMFAAASISGASANFLKKGFRESSPRPARFVANTFFAKAIVPLSIERIDPFWVHGRDSNITLDRLRTASVGIVGCGAIGGFLARGLAQAGVDSLTLVDFDEIRPQNLGRHVLGSEWLGWRKADAMSAQIRRDFPHIRDVQPHTRAFQNLKPGDLEGLAQCDVLVLAGLDLPAELAIDHWIDTIEHPPTRVWTWTEEFALAGHAVALIGRDRFSEGLDADGFYFGRLTHGWSQKNVVLGEAGCGVTFHPYDAVDMSSTVLMAQRLIIDVILGKVPQSTNRMWLGNRDIVIERGGVPSELFDRSHCEISRAWEP